MSSIHGQKCANTVQRSSLTMSEATERVNDLLSRAAGIITAAKGAIKIRQAMNLVGFTPTRRDMQHDIVSKGQTTINVAQHCEQARSGASCS